MSKYINEVLNTIQNFAIDIKEIAKIITVYFTSDYIKGEYVATINYSNNDKKNLSYDNIFKKIKKYMLHNLITVIFMYLIVKIINLIVKYIVAIQTVQNFQILVKLKIMCICIHKTQLRMEGHV